MTMAMAQATLLRRNGAPIVTRRLARCAFFGNAADAPWHGGRDLAGVMMMAARHTEETRRIVASVGGSATFLWRTNALPTFQALGTKPSIVDHVSIAVHCVRWGKP